MAITSPDPKRADVWLSQDSAEPDLVVVGVPVSTSSGAGITPLAVRERFGRFSTYHEESGVDLSHVAVRDVGNWPVSELGAEARTCALTELSRGLPKVPLTIYLGGDGTVTRSLAAASADDQFSVGLISFDNRHDVDSVDDGPTSYNSIRGLIDEDGFSGTNAFQIGINSFTDEMERRAYCDSVGIQVRTVADVEEAGMGVIVSQALDALEHCDHIYIDVDLNALDEALAPGCPTAMPGGLTVRQLADAVRLCATNGKVRFMDFVGVEAAMDTQLVTLDTMAYLTLSAVAGFAER